MYECVTGFSKVSDLNVVVSCSDTLIYAMSATAAGEEKTVEILAETVLRPKFSDQEVSMSHEGMIKKN